MSCLDNRKNKTLVSVVVPVYKVEKYLDRCVKSLVNQTYKDIEIILVDDGSPDSCPGLCDEYRNKYENIRVVHKKKRQDSAVRVMQDYQRQRGEYVGFVDSDDDVDIHMYERMYQVITSEKVDFVMSDYIRVLDEGNQHLKTTGYTRRAI